MISLYLTQRVIDSDSLPNTYAGEDVSDQGAADILNFDTPTSSSISPSSDNDNIASSTRYPLANFVTYSKFSTAHAQFLAHAPWVKYPTAFPTSKNRSKLATTLCKRIDALKKKWNLYDYKNVLSPRQRWFQFVLFYAGSCNSAKVVDIKVLYGLSSTPRNLVFLTPPILLKTFGFTQSYTDYSLFSFKRSGIDLHVLVYVDDLIVAGNNSYVITKFKASMSACIHMKDLGALKYFIVIEIARHPEGLFLSQRKYALDILSESGLLGAKLSHPVKAETRGVTR
ncbi:retrovirus-related pol polyprotein from transposon TNT 1-94 [Tanacetum coccineum]